MPKPTEPPKPICISDSTVIDGRWYERGTPLPFERVEDLPPNLRPLVTGDPEAEEAPNEPRGSFQTGVLYSMTPEGDLGRPVRRRSPQRQVAEMEAANAEADWIVEEINSDELPPEIAQDLQEQHEEAVALQKAQARIDAERSDAVSDFAAKELAPPKLFVKRGSRHYQPALKAKLKPGEPVYARQADGSLQCIGTTSGDAEPQLPDPPIIT